MKNKNILAAILILAFVFRLIFILINPIFQQPDEEAHFRYIEYVLSNKQIPVQGGFYAEYFQPPLYYAIASFFLAIAKSFTSNMWYHVISMRFLSVFIGMLTVYLTYRIASLLFADRNLVLGATAFAAFLPSYISANGNITNANFADFLSTLIIYVMLIALVKGDNYKRVALLGILAGFALITRLSALPVFLTVIFLFFIMHYNKPIKIIKPVATIIVIALVISGWFFIRNYLIYGDLLGYNAMKLSTPPGQIKAGLIFTARLIGWTFVTFWAGFGRTNNIFIGSLESVFGVAIFATAYFLLLLFTISSFYGLYKFLKKCRVNKKAPSTNKKNAFIIFVFHIALLCLSFISFNVYAFQPQGRYFYPAISSIAVLFTFGIYNLFSSMKKSVFLKAYLAAFILLDLFSAISIVYYYL